MNIIYVLVVFIYSGYAPTIEFKTKEKCDAAIVQFQKMVASQTSPFEKDSKKAFCMRIEK